MATKAAAGAADQGILKQTAQAEGGDGGAAIASYQAFNQGFAGASKPGMEAMAMEYQKQNATFDALMQNKPPLETVPLLTDHQLSGGENIPGMEDLMKEVSGLYQDQARILSKNKGDLKAQKEITKSASYIQNIDAGNKALAQINVRGYENNGTFSLGVSEEQGAHLKEIQLAVNGQMDGVKIEYPKEDGYNMKVTMPDGTVYDKNNPLPVSQGEFKNGSTASLKFANNAIEDGATASAPMNKGVAANSMLTTINELKSDGNPDQPASNSEKLDMMFRDLTPDDQDISYATDFASGNLPAKFYQDENGKPITFDADGSGEGESKPAFDDQGNFQWTDKESKDFLRQNTGMQHNLKMFSEYYGSAVADLHNEQYNVKKGNAGQYFKGLDGSDNYGTVTQINQQKKSLYSDLLVVKSLNNPETNKSYLAEGDYDAAIKGLKTTFRDTDVKMVQGKNKNHQIGIMVGKEKRSFDLKDPRQVRMMEQFLAKSKSFNQMALGADPNGWTDLDGSPLIMDLDMLDPNANNILPPPVENETESEGTNTNTSNGNGFGGFNSGRGSGF
tara:strand:+ start:1571 stop:3250 length:1680 start_codon:yes stop_codon:yes gene_type:complete